LTFIHLGNHSEVEELINFEKLRMIAKEVRALTNMCSVPLDLFSMLELGGQQPSSAMVSMNQLTTGQHLANRRQGRKKTAGIPNPKRMFEEAQMVRRVKAYLKSMKVITDEEELHKMSMECEPPLGGLPPPPPLSTTRKRNPSPTPSAASSASSTPSHYSTGEKPSQFGDEKHRLPQSLLAAAPNKFGAASPQAVKKLLSLSEQSRPKVAASERELASSRAAGHQRQKALSASLERASTGVKPDLASPVNLTLESSSVSGRAKESGGGKARVRKAQLSLGSAASNDSGFGSGGLDQQGRHSVDGQRQCSESPTLPPRRRYHQHYHRQHGKPSGLSVHHAVPVEVVGGGQGGQQHQQLLPAPHQLAWPEPRPLIPRAQHRGVPPRHPPYSSYLPDDDDETQVSAV
jgi:Rap guanine nucleotide exchange factor 2